MKLLATYSHDEPISLLLSDLETGEPVHHLPANQDRRCSLTYQAEQWAKTHGHTVAEYDRESLTNGESLSA